MTAHATTIVEPLHLVALIAFFTDVCDPRSSDSVARRESIVSKLSGLTVATLIHRSRAAFKRAW